MRDWVLATLRDAGHAADHAPTAQQALAALTTTRADLLIVDLDIADGPAARVIESAQQLQPGLGALYVADADREGADWSEVPPGGILLYGPTGPDLLPAVAVAVSRTSKR